MSNMSYCQFENMLDDVDGDLSSFSEVERLAAEKLIGLCKYTYSAQTNQDECGIAGREARAYRTGLSKLRGHTPPGRC